ncbi:MAG TPA: UDP-N-acetylmuramoyl-tripeptide--D-alanyl-D-alanine ligase [Nevskiaceae bacterium]|nr:UDP-N-acetylmuramoyl-tripeptide--D-alanyl-D-alanine ligase [Nevskiaceae bacterium]
MMTLREAAELAGGALHGADARVERVVSDTRGLLAGDLFVALRGERHDAHDFVAAAAAAGAVAALVERQLPLPLPQIVVADSLAGLQRLAAGWRARHRLPVIGVTGSNGKTTTKQMLAALLAARGPVLATRGNLNTHIGVPLTLLGLRESQATAVIEMGANHPGEIALLAALARPDIALVTQAGDAHLEGFGSREGVARAKGELFQALDGRGVAVINADDVYAPLWRRFAGAAAVLQFGLGAAADVSARQLREEGESQRFELVTPAGTAEVWLPLPGRHNVLNALGAAACGLALGLDPATLAEGFARLEPAQGRSAIRQTAAGDRLIDDSYNANPTSLRAGLELLARQPGRRIAVLGAMAELGAQARELHVAAGSAARALGIEALHALGRHAADYVEGFGPRGQAHEQLESLLAALAAEPGPRSLLIKGSRSARMERVVAALDGQIQPGDPH